MKNEIFTAKRTAAHAAARSFTVFSTYAFSLEKYSFTSFTTVPDSKNNATKFGIDIRPLHVSAIPQIIPRSTVAPRIATSAYTSINGFTIFVENTNSTHRAP